VIVDSHQHFWDLGRFDNPWLTDDLEPVRRNFAPSDVAVSGSAGCACS
jgi:L-fuconolactonase